MNTKKVLLPIGALAAVAMAHTASAQTIINEQFNYADQAALMANWTLGTAPLSLNNADGSPSSPSVTHPGTATSANLWSGSTFSLTPTAANPVRLSADLFSTGAANQANTVGLRQNGGANPLFEMGMYRIFDNIQTGPDTTTTTATTDGIGIRTISIGQDLPGQDWVKMGANYTGWARFEATFTDVSVTTRIDLGIDGSWDFTFTETGVAAIQPFSQLRIHSPVTSTGGGFGVDNIVLEVVPEPSTYALLGLGGAAMAFAARRRKRA